MRFFPVLPVHIAPATYSISDFYYKQRIFIYKKIPEPAGESL